MWHTKIRCTFVSQLFFCCPKEHMHTWPAMTRKALVGFLLLLLLPSDTSLVKIHRAAPRTPKGQLKDVSDESLWVASDLPGLFTKREAWFYTIPATILVGMCGIFPLLVIPVEAGQALREGGWYWSEPILFWFLVFWFHLYYTDLRMVARVWDRKALGTLVYLWK